MLQSVLATWVFLGRWSSRFLRRGVLDHRPDAMPGGISPALGEGIGRQSAQDQQGRDHRVDSDGFAENQAGEGEGEQWDQRDRGPGGCGADPDQRPGVLQERAGGAQAASDQQGRRNTAFGY